MADVNRMTNLTNMRWKLIDNQTGAEGEAIDWRFRVGQQVKVRIVNEMDSDHPMHHPFHIHVGRIYHRCHGTVRIGASHCAACARD